MAPTRTRRRRSGRRTSGMGLCSMTIRWRWVLRRACVRELMPFALVLLAVAIMSANVEAQSSASVFGPGTPRVRLTVARGTVTGDLILQTPDSLLLQTVTGSGEGQQFRQR